MSYKLRIGLWKSLKNSLVVLVLPGLLYAFNGYEAWLPREYWPVGVALAGFLGYLGKNWLQNR